MAKHVFGLQLLVERDARIAASTQTIRLFTRRSLRSNQVVEPSSGRWSPSISAPFFGEVAELHRLGDAGDLDRRREEHGRAAGPAIVRDAALVHPVFA